MIRLSRLDGQEFILNADLIETIEMTPDTVIVLVTHRKLVVRESADEVINRVIAYRRACGAAGFAGWPGYQAAEEP
jgi:flagellar protein FlbD